MSFYNRLKEQNTSETFFNALKTKLQIAQNRLKSDMMACNDSRQRHCMLYKISSYRCYDHIMKVMEKSCYYNHIIIIRHQKETELKKISCIQYAIIIFRNYIHTFSAVTNSFSGRCKFSCILRLKPLKFFV